MRRPVRQSGFVLLMTLVLVLLAGVTLAGVARRSLIGAIEAEQASDALKRRWAMISCQATLLPMAERVLDEAERGSGRELLVQEESTYQNDPMARRHITCRLAGIEYDLLFTDEQAKWNINRALDDADRASVQSAVRRLVSIPQGHVQVNLRPQVRQVDSIEDKTDRLPISGYGQVFENLTPHDLFTAESNMARLGDKITCWGDGRINIRRATDKVIKQACEKTIGPRITAALIRARKENPYRPLTEMVHAIDKLDARQRSRVLARLTDRSTCHGLWMVARGDQPPSHTFTVGVTALDENKNKDEEHQQPIPVVVKRYNLTW